MMNRLTIGWSEMVVDCLPIWKISEDQSGDGKEASSPASAGWVEPLARRRGRPMSRPGRSIRRIASLIQHLADRLCLAISRRGLAGYLAEDAIKVSKRLKTDIIGNFADA